MIKISPSILAAKLHQLPEEINSIQTAGADWIHVDVMDGQFVPNLTFGAPMLKAVRALSTLPLDVHLMVNEPDHLIPDFADAGADIITVHIEAIRHLNRTIQLIKRLGMKAGVTLNPGTSASVLEAIIDEVDMVLVMTVNPGYAGQQFIPSVVPKISQIAAMIKATGKSIDLEVDGGINESSISSVIAAGANVIVVGNGFFSAADRKKLVNELKQTLR
jgi:ribulose-phosphate 3-epimerase